MTLLITNKDMKIVVVYMYVFQFDIKHMSQGCGIVFACCSYKSGVECEVTKEYKFAKEDAVQCGCLYMWEGRAEGSPTY